MKAPKKKSPKSTKTKKYGYVIEMRKTSEYYPGFYQDGGKRGYAGPLRTAFVDTRRVAFMLRDVGVETVRKVELFKNGNPKRIISRK